MAGDLPNSHFPDEAELLAWVEGEPLAREREQAVAKALAEDRALARRLEAMRADRAALRAMPQVAAPPGLMAAVGSALQPVLERQMLLGLRDGETVSAHPPVSIVQPVKRSIMQAFFADRVGRRLAAAAALLLVVGGATYLGTTYLSGRTAPRPATIARNEPPKTDRVGAPAAPTRIAAAEANKSATPAAKEQESPATGAPIAAVTSADQQTPPEAETTVAAADASEYGTWAVGPFLPDLDGARAAALAKEGRLIIRVTALDPTARNGGLAERVRRANGSMFRLGDEASPALVQLLAPPAAPARPEPAREAYTPPSVAGDSKFDDPAPLVGPPAPAEWAVPAIQSVYLVQVRLDSAAMDALKGALSGGYGEAQYEELAEPLPEGSAAVNPTSVVWWSQGPSGWAWWASVPVVVDTER